jgi:hypothetical protein
MKYLILIFFFFSCENENISTNKLVGKWEEIGTKSTIEFTYKGKFLTDEKVVDDCCNYGAYEQIGNEINFKHSSNTKFDCSAVSCLAKVNWEIIDITDEVLILKIDSLRKNYKRIN